MGKREGGRDWTQSSINERIRFIVDQFFGGNATQMAKAVYVKQSTIRDIIGDRGSAPSYETLRQIVDSATVNVSPEWLMSGKGEMAKRSEAASPAKTYPLIPLDAVAGYGAGDNAAVTYEDCEQYQVPDFAAGGMEFLIRVSGSSMYPKYSSGDVLACRKLKDILFFQWGKVYVIDSSQGILVKRLFEGDDPDSIICVSDNKEKYPPFPMPKSDIRSLSLVVGVLRLE